MPCRLLTGFLALAALGLFLVSVSGAWQVQGELLTPLSGTPIAVGGGEIGDLLRKWFANGTAAGNVGDYYDNRDGGHSMLNLAPYPQVRKIEYSEEQIKKNEHWAIQRRVLPHVVFGNSSTSAAPTTGGSNARAYYANPGGLAFLFSQYSRNNLYIYPEHQDYDPGHNGIGGGYGDLYPANSPYLIISQGSSGSDQAFMQAMPYVLAAFKPEVKKRLIQSGMLMPTIQMIFRITNKQINGAKDYLTGKAHPTVFQGGDVDAPAMVEMAHRMNLSDLPPIALIKTLREDAPVNGIDYFEPEFTEKLADTPAVIARIFRGSGYQRKIVVSAEDSKDLNNKPLKYYWSVLWGDPGKIKIEYSNTERSAASITVSYHERRPIAQGSSIESNRVDIGVFVHNGAYYSPPAFVTFYALDSEARTYRPGGQPMEIGYGAGTATVSVADWTKFFAALDPNAKSWPSEFLRSQFKPEELTALAKVSEEFGKSSEALLAAQELKKKAEAAKNAADIAAADKAINAARESESNALAKKMPGLPAGAEGLMQKILDSLTQGPNLWDSNASDLKRLYESASAGAKEAVDLPRQILTRYDVTDKLTSYQKLTIERLNAAILGNLILPGAVKSERRENYVDPRIAASKDWRDVYRYAPDETPLGWRRYQGDKIEEFNAEGLLIVDKDSQGRCTRAREVRYELDKVNNFVKRVKVVQTGILRHYEYDGPTDLRGRMKPQ